MLQNSDDNSLGLPRDISHQMLEKYDGQIASGKQSVYRKNVGSPDLLQSEIVNLPLDARMNRNYGNIINSFDKDASEKKASDHMIIRSLDTMSDQTLYKQTSQMENETQRQESVVKLMRQATVQKPLLDNPNNLHVESKQYKQRKATSMVMMGGRRMPSDAQVLSTSALKNRAMEEGDKMLSEHLNGFLPNRKLEKFQ